MYPSVIKIVPKDNYQVYVEFDNNECRILNMEPYLNFGVFSKIKDLNLFSQVRVSFDTVEWGNGIDLAPQFVYEKCIKEKCLTNWVRL
ncbi:hypothetical protein AU255_11470 [Methyloprofundus sedimenti]|uniref:DUF2442 domain-containing protein n=1 Tax=Methyloprofundus sedimenti TaxID=1420851 RepID=A0A1V8MAR5_9GAMM|nr:DUF2442 domain-containing protein [Methyloprofundus sedimenti]OQK18403.1 hypothetical protein AU255_11470 [Methyloprofundus sedimenti]